MKKGGQRNMAFKVPGQLLMTGGIKGVPLRVRNQVISAIFIWYSCASSLL